MNIFYFGYSLEESSGGIENYTFTVLKHLKKMGHNVIVYTINGKNNNFENICFKRNKYIDKFFLGNRIRAKLHKQCREVDIFLCGHLFLANYMEVIVAKHIKKYHLFVYGIDCWAGRFQSRYSKLKNLNKIISISSFTSEQIRSQGFKGEIVYLPCVLDVDKFPNINIDRDTQKVNFITVGRLSSLEKYKGHDKVIEAINILVNKLAIQNIEYHIVGKGDDRQRLELLTKKLRLEQYVKFYGFVSDEELPKVYAQSDVFIMPSAVSLDPANPKGEGFGIVFIEASMYELPMIGPNDGGSTDFIDDKVNGLECDPLSPFDIADKMRFMVENRDLAKSFGKNAKEKTLKKFTLRQLDGYLKNLVTDV